MCGYLVLDRSDRASPRNSHFNKRLRMPNSGFYSDNLLGTNALECDPTFQHKDAYRTVNRRRVQGPTIDLNNRALERYTGYGRIPVDTRVCLSIGPLTLLTIVSRRRGWMVALSTCLQQATKLDSENAGVVSHAVSLDFHRGKSSYSSDKNHHRLG